MKLKNILLTSMLSTALSMGAQDFKDWPIPVGPISEMSYSSSMTHFCVWSPKAEQAKVNLYHHGTGGLPYESYPLKKAADGTWSTSVKGNLKGVFYTFQVLVNGKWQDETQGIFAKAVGVNGVRAQVMDMRETNPAGWEADQRPALNSFSDVVLYEMHHRDFSVDPESGIRHQGKYLALTEHGTKNRGGLATGIDHLTELGVNHVHILPSYDYGSVDETRLHTPQYNWGYDPVNYNVPEGSYSTNPEDPATRIKEFKQMVMAMHRAGIRVVLDVVYNHVFDANSSAFQRTAPDYFFRHNDDGTLANGSGCGNETASDMPMMRKYMVESVLYWINEYHIDGFRFDLMGIHDLETMNAIREAVNNVDASIFIYGEGWAAATPKLPDTKLAMKAHVAEIPGIAAFGDEMRDGLRGGWSNDKEGAFLIGVPGNEESVKFGIVGAINHPDIDFSKVNYSKEAWAAQPTQMISYVSCHDDMCIADRIKATTEKASKEERVRLQKLAETAVLTSQGVPFIWCGDEVMRDKKGVHNSFNSPDSINTILWKQKSEYQDLFYYMKNLITLRKNHPAFRMGTTDKVIKNLRFLPVKGNNVIAYKLNGEAVGDSWKEIIVVLNSNKKATKVEVPQGEYTVVVRDGQVYESGSMPFKGHLLLVPAQSALIMYK